MEDAYADVRTMKYIPGMWRAIKADMVKVVCTDSGGCGVVTDACEVV